MTGQMILCSVKEIYCLEIKSKNKKKANIIGKMYRTVVPFKGGGIFNQLNSVQL